MPTSGDFCGRGNKGRVGIFAFYSPTIELTINAVKWEGAGRDGRPFGFVQGRLPAAGTAALRLTCWFFRRLVEQLGIDRRIDLQRRVF